MAAFPTLSSNCPAPHTFKTFVGGMRPKLGDRLLLHCWWSREQTGWFKVNALQLDESGVVWMTLQRD